jgi:hypothetical protein
MLSTRVNRWHCKQCSQNWVERRGPISCLVGFMLVIHVWCTQNTVLKVAAVAGSRAELILLHCWFATALLWALESGYQCMGASVRHLTVSLNTGHWFVSISRQWSQKGSNCILRKCNYLTTLLNNKINNFYCCIDCPYVFNGYFLC